MGRLYFLLWITTFFLVGCASSANAQSQPAKALTDTVSMNVPEKQALLQTAASETVSHDPPASCPITIPQNPLFIPPPPYNSMVYEGEFWYGSNTLWSAVRHNGTWEGLPHNPEGYTQKVFWWRDGYVWTDEPQPELMVTAERLNGPATLVYASKATNASASDIGSAMLVTVDLPGFGCWKIKGQYGDAELSFVVWVAP